MVKQYGELYLELRRALLQQEEPQTAGLMAREVLCAFSGKSQEELLAQRELYAPEEVCKKVTRALRRLMCWGSGTFTG